MSNRRIAHAPELALAFTALMALSEPTLLVAAPVPVDKAGTESEASIHNEVPDDPPATPARAAARAVTAAPVTFGRFTHHQVNVSAGGADIVGDAANEPSIAVDPTDPGRMAIGWRHSTTSRPTFGKQASRSRPTADRPGPRARSTTAYSAVTPYSTMT
jgi:hypothetical protein